MSAVLSYDVYDLIYPLLNPAIKQFIDSSSKSSQFPVPHHAEKSEVIKSSGKEVKVLMKGAQGYGLKFCESSDNPIFFKDYSVGLGDMFPNFKKSKYYLMYFDMDGTTARMFVDEDKTELLPCNGSGILLNHDNRFTIEIEKLANHDGGHCCIFCLKAQLVEKLRYHYCTVLILHIDFSLVN